MNQLLAECKAETFWGPGCTFVWPVGFALSLALPESLCSTGRMRPACRVRAAASQLRDACDLCAASTSPSGSFRHLAHSPHITCICLHAGIMIIAGSDYDYCIICFCSVRNVIQKCLPRSEGDAEHWLHRVSVQELRLASQGLRGVSLLVSGPTFSATVVDSVSLKGTSVSSTIHTWGVGGVKRPALLCFCFAPGRTQGREKRILTEPL